MGANIGLIGPGMIVLVVLVLLDALAAAFLVLDAWRRPATDYAGVPEGRWFYIVPQGLYAIVYVIAQVPFLVALMPWANLYAMVSLIVAAQQLAYLLRVAFPTHGRLEARLEARFQAIADAVVADTDEDPTIARSTTHA
jgi:hypothetical protein